MREMFDIPPVWLAQCLVLTWAQDRLLPVEVGAAQVALRVTGLVLILGAAGLVLAAVYQFLRHKTTIIPHRVPTGLIRSGVFRLTRNPIYLADALVLGGFALYLGALPSLVLVPLFVWWIGHHFIRAEENRMRAAFGDAFSEYERSVRRWI